MWQDIALASVSIILAYALVPQVVQGFKTKKKTVSTQTAVIAFVGMFIVTSLYLIMGLYFASAVAFVTGILWLIIFLQGIAYKKK
jgi:uncharacterized protein with PQ loop repeat